MSKVGIEKKLFYGAAGSKAATEMKKVRDVNVEDNMGEADVTTREAEGWGMTEATLREHQVAWEMIANANDEEFNTFLTHFLDGSAFALYTEEGAGKGYDADYVLVEFGEDQALEEGVTVKMVAVPTLVTRAPQRI